MFGLESLVFPIVAATAISIALAVIWFSPYCFGEVWQSETRVPDDLPPSSVWTFAVGTVLQCALFFCVALVQTIVPDEFAPTPLVALISVVGILPLLIVMFWERRSRNFVMVVVGYMLLSLAVGACILMWWPW